MIDTHAHIYTKEFKDDLESIVTRSQESDIQKIFMPNIDHTSIDAMLEVERRYPEICYAMMGLHPSSVGNDFEKELYIVEEWLNTRNFLAIGEIGIDLFWDKTFKSHQEEAFEIQINWAKERQLPIAIHCRDAFETTIDIVESLWDESLKGVFHCFTGSKADADRITKMGFYLGIGGVSTFKNGGLDKVLPEVDLQHIILETDSPYLAPVPYRGKRNEPAYLPLIAQRIAAIKAISVEEVAKRTTQNAQMLFNIQ